MEFTEVVSVIVDDYITAVAPEGYKLKEAKEQGKKWLLTYVLDKNWAIAKMLTQFSFVKKGGTAKHQLAEWLTINVDSYASYSNRIFIGFTEYKALYTFSYMGYEFAVVKPPKESFGVLTIPSGHYVCTADNQYELLKEFFVRSAKFNNLPAIVAEYEYNQLYRYVSPILLIA